MFEMSSGRGSERTEVTEREVVRPSNKIKDTPFRQQILSAWQPIISVRTVWKWFIIFGIISIPMGVTVLYISMMATETLIEYTAGDCLKCRNSLVVNKAQCMKCVVNFDKSSDCSCSKVFSVPEDMKFPVYMYYQLDNFHQSHRKYVKSRDDNQLLGNIMKKDSKTPVQPSKLCKPLDKDENGKIYFPCGAIAYSMFSDVLKIETSTGSEITIKKDNIAWPDEKNNKFKNPEAINKMNYLRNSTSASKTFNLYFTKPKFWTDSLYKDWWDNGGLVNELFVNWMHPSPTPRFRKLYGIIDKKVVGCTAGVLCKNDNYKLVITYRFDVHGFDGKKSVVLATTSLLGGRNLFLGILAIVMGVITLIIGTMFFFIHRRHMKRIHPHHRRNSVNNPNNIADEVLAKELTRTLFT